MKEQSKKYTISVRLSEEEYQAINEKAKLNSCTVSEFLRLAAKERNIVNPAVLSRFANVANEVASKMSDSEAKHYGEELRAVWLLLK